MQKKLVKDALETALKTKRTGALAVAKVNPEYERVMPEFFEALRSGEGVPAIARRFGVNPSGLRKYAWRVHRDEYEAAQKASAEALAERAVLAAAERNEAQEKIETTYADGSTTTAVKSFDNVQRSKLAAEVLWKMAATKDPERFGSKGATTDSAVLAAEIMAARKRIDPSASSDENSSVAQ